MAVQLKIIIQMCCSFRFRPAKMANFEHLLFSNETKIKVKNTGPK